MNEIKVRRPRRSKADIESAIQRAAVTLIKKKGFSLALVTDIVKRAQIEPVVFYNRYRNLEEFYDVFVKKYDSWLSKIVGSTINPVTDEVGYADAIGRVLDALLSDPIMTELLRWEVCEGTPVTERTARIRELDCSHVVNEFKEICPGESEDVAALSALVIAGIYYLVLHKDRSTFAGIDINTTEGRECIHRAIKLQARLLFADTDMPYDAEDRIIRIDMLRRALAAEGLTSPAIERCINAAGIV